MCDLKYELMDRGFQEEELNDWINDELDLSYMREEEILRAIDVTPRDTICDVTLEWMESMRQTDGFIGYPENDMDFDLLSEDEIEHYFETWILDNRI